MREGLLAVFLVGCAGAGQATEWDSDDPHRPMMVAVAPSEAARVEAAASDCGLQHQERLSRSGLAWIVMRDVLARESESDERVACLARWAMANPRIRVMFFGKLVGPERGDD